MIGLSRDGVTGNGAGSLQNLIFECHAWIVLFEPFLEILLGLGKLLDIIGSVLEGNEWLTLWRNDWLVEGAGP